MMAIYNLYGETYRVVRDVSPSKMPFLSLPTWLPLKYLYTRQVMI